MKRSKKVLSAAVAGTLVAAQMAMPVMAADGGQLDVGVTTKTAVIRVEVPTTLSIAVDQFMMEDSGTQIHSTEFAMTNKSAVDVKVEVESIAELGASTKLVSTKAGAAGSTVAGEAWLGIAAKSAASSYDDPTTDTSDSTATPPVSDVPETLETLTEANANVVTFAQGAGAEGRASQVFYLAKGDGAVAYKMLNANESAAAISYAQFYELTAVTAADQNALDALIEAGDIYVAGGAAADGQTLTLVEKGGTHTYAAAEVYYTVADEATAKGNLDGTKLYVYGGTANAASAGGEAAFRYIGILSAGQDSWSEEDIKKISIKYNIVGVTAEKYAEVEDNCEYGLYMAAGPQVSMSAAGVITMSGLTADRNYAHSAVLEYDGQSDELDTDPNMTWGTDAWSATDGGTLVFTLSPAWLSALSGKSATVTVALSDGSTISVTQQF